MSCDLQWIKVLSAWSLPLMFCFGALDYRESLNLSTKVGRSGKLFFSTDYHRWEAFRTYRLLAAYFITINIILWNICQTSIYYTGKRKDGLRSILWADVNTMRQEPNTVKQLYTNGYVLYKSHYGLLHVDYVISKSRAAQSTAGPLVFITNLRAYRTCSTCSPRKVSSVYWFLFDHFRVVYCLQLAAV